jgi:hypothetical protein
MKVHSHFPQGERPSGAPILLNADGFTSAAVAYLYTTPGQEPSVGQALARCVALAASNRLFSQGH